MAKGTSKPQLNFVGWAAIALAKRARVSGLCTGPRIATALARNPAARAAKASRASAVARPGPAWAINPSIGTKLGVSDVWPDFCANRACAASTSGKLAQAPNRAKTAIMPKARIIPNIPKHTIAANLSRPQPPRQAPARPPNPPNPKPISSLPKYSPKTLHHNTTLAISSWPKYLKTLPPNPPPKPNA